MNNLDLVEEALPKPRGKSGDWCDCEECEQKMPALAALSAVREEMAKMREALVVAAVPLEVIAGQIAVKPYSELSGDLQSKIQSAVTDIRTALFGATEVQHAE